MIGQSETSDAYPYVVVDFGDGWRVIECAAGFAGLQWIVQKRISASRYPWANRSFCRTKEALLRCAKHSHPALDVLPDWFPEGQARTADEIDSEFEVSGVA